MLSLNRKLLRELWRLKGQVASIALVVAAGIMSVVTMRGSYDSLVIAQQQYYSEARFADIWAPLVRAPLSLIQSIEEIDGVDAVDNRVTFIATLDLDDSNIPAQARFVSLPEYGRPTLNNIVIKSGRYIEPSATNETLISEKFAVARDFHPGDQIRVIINGRARDLDIVGIAISPEHTYAVPPGALYPEDDRYAVMWASRNILGPAFEMDGAFNEVFVTITDNTNPDAVIDALDSMLDPFGGFGAYPRDDQPSHLILQAELDQNRVTGAIIPIIFLGVAVFLLYLVLGRLISTQRGEIAVLKAFGYKNWEIGQHYMMFAVVAVLSGGALGTVGGVVLGDSYIALYGRYFAIPDLEYQLTPALLMFSFIACALGALGGAMAAVRRAIRLPPAEAMRPEAPAKFKPGPIERLGFGALLGNMGRMILRNLERKPVQGFFSSLGVAMSVAILTIGFFMFDSINHLMDLQFRQIQREDLNLTFREVLPEQVAFDLAHLPGVNRVETYRVLPARLRFGHVEKEVAIQGMDPAGRLRRIVNSSKSEIPVPISGMVISSLLAEQLGATTGDELIVEILQGKRNVGQRKITGVVEDFLGMSVYMSKQALGILSGEPNIVSGALLAVDNQNLDELYQELKQTPAITGVASPADMLASFEEQLAETLLIGAGFLLGFACVISIGVIYNAARISLSERGRELASLRVMGFHRREVALLLLGEQGIITLVAIPIGWAIGYGMSYLVTNSLQTDIYRIPFVAEPKTYLFTAIIVLLTALASGWAVKGRLDRYDLVEVLKTRE